MAIQLGASVNLDDRDVQKGMRQLVRAGKNMRPVFRALGKPFREDLKSWQKKKASPDGPWEPRAESTRGRDKRGKSLQQKRKGKAFTKKLKRRRRSRILGKLPTSISTKASAQAFRGESKIPFAMAQQEGAQVGRGAVLPSRKFMFLSEPFLQLADKFIGDGLEKGWATK